MKFKIQYLFSDEGVHEQISFIAYRSVGLNMCSRTQAPGHIELCKDDGQFLFVIYTSPWVVNSVARSNFRYTYSTGGSTTLTTRLLFTTTLYSW